MKKIIAIFLLSIFPVLIGVSGAETSSINTSSGITQTGVVSTGSLISRKKTRVIPKRVLKIKNIIAPIEVVNTGSVDLSGVVSTGSQSPGKLGLSFDSIMSQNAKLYQENIEQEKIQEEQNKKDAERREREYQDYLKTIPSTSSSKGGYSSSTSSDSSNRQCWVNGYTRSNGTHVSGYYRSCR